MKEELKRELEEIASFLLNKNATQGLKVPDHYFDQLPDKVLDKIKATSLGKEADNPVLLTVANSENPVSRTLLWRSMPIWAAAASIVLLITAGVFWWQTPKAAGRLPELTEADIRYYIQENEADFSEDLILETLTDDKMEIDIEDTRIEQKDIEKYLEELDPDEVEALF